MAGLSKTGSGPRSTLALTSICFCSTSFRNTWMLQIRHPLCLSSRDSRPDHLLDILRLSSPPSPIHIGAPRDPRDFQSHPFSSSFLGHYPDTKYHTPLLDQSSILHRIPLPYFNLEVHPSTTTSSFSEDLLPYTALTSTIFPTFY